MRRAAKSEKRKESGFRMAIVHAVFIDIVKRRSAWGVTWSRQPARALLRRKLRQAGWFSTSGLSKAVLIMPRARQRASFAPTGMVRQEPGGHC